MLEEPLRKITQPLLDQAAAKAEGWGLSANAITAIGLLFGIGAGFVLTLHLYAIGILLVLLNRLCDALDGVVARRKGATAFGGVLDSASDFVFYAGVPFGFALALPDSAIAVAFLLFGRTAYASSNYAYASFAKDFKPDARRSSSNRSPAARPRNGRWTSSSSSRRIGGHAASRSSSEAARPTATL